jgi:rubredoxin-NAD+ reductase
MTEAPIIVLGSGLAGHAVVRALRAGGDRRRLILVTAEDGHFYSKPALSVSFSKRTTSDALVSRPAPQVCAELGIELWARRHVTALARAARRVIFADSELEYSKLVLALGARPSVPPVPGLAECRRIAVLNHLDDHRALAAQLADARRVAILGAGLVGCELASDLARAGHDVCLIERAGHAIPQLVPPRFADRLRHELERAGVECRFGAAVTRVNEHARSVHLGFEDHTDHTADLVIAATGQRPADELARHAGLASRDGIIVDRQLRTSDQHIYALGDVARILPFNLQFVAPIAPCAGIIARAIAPSPAPQRLTLPALPVSVKVSCFPILLSAGERAGDWQWRYEEDPSGIAALACDDAGTLRAFALGGSRINDRAKYLSRLPPLLADEETIESSPC